MKNGTVTITVDKHTTCRDTACNKNVYGWFLCLSDLYMGRYAELPVNHHHWLKWPSSRSNIPKNDDCDCYKIFKLQLILNGCVSFIYRAGPDWLGNHYGNANTHTHTYKVLYSYSHFISVMPKIQMTILREWNLNGNFN